jgi:hypothetical protein
VPSSSVKLRAGSYLPPPAASSLNGQSSESLKSTRYLTAPTTSLCHVNADETLVLGPRVLGILQLVEPIVLQGVLRAGDPRWQFCRERRSPLGQGSQRFGPLTGKVASEREGKLVVGVRGGQGSGDSVGQGLERVPRLSAEQLA